MVITEGPPAGRLSSSHSPVSGVPSSTTARVSRTASDGWLVCQRAMDENVRQMNFFLDIVNAGPVPSLTSNGAFKTDR